MIIEDSITVIVRTWCYQNILSQCYRKPSPKPCSQEAGLYLQQTSRSCHTLFIIFYGIFQHSCLLPRIKQLKRESLIVWQIHSQSQHFQTGGSTTPQTYFDTLVAFSGLFENNPIKITVWTVQKHFLTCK